MENSKLLETLSAFTAEELQDLKLFLHSPYFQKGGISEDEIKLFAYLQKQHPRFDKKAIDKQKVFAVLYPDTKLIKGKLEKKMSALFHHIQRYIIQRTWEGREQPVRKLLLLSHFYQERKTPRLYRLIIEKIRKALQANPQKDKIHYLNEFIVQSEISEHQSLNTTRKEDLNLPTTLRSLDIFYLAKKLEYSCGLLSTNKSHRLKEIQGDLSWLGNIDTAWPQQDYLEIPLIKTYFKAFSFLQNRDDTQAHQDLLLLLKEHKAALSKDDLKALRTLCRNFSIYQHNQGNKEYLKRTVLLYQEDLKDGLLYHQNGLLPSTIRNMVSLGLKQKQYDWVYQLLEDHKDRIVGTQYPKEVYQFNLAHYFFELQDYEQTLNHLADHYEDLYYQIAARRLEIKVHFEEDSPLLESKMDAFKVFIYRLAKEKLPELPRRGNKNFFNALRQIINPATEVNLQRAERLIIKIQQQQIIVEKEWLLEKIEGLKNRKG